MKLFKFFNVLAFVIFWSIAAASQEPAVEGKQRVRTVSIPISIFTKKELKEGQTEEFIQAERLLVRENKEEQAILSIRSVSDAPLSLAILIQEDLESTFNLQLSNLAKFIRNLPKGSRVMVAYLRSGSLQIKQKFTADTDAAAKSLRIVSSSDALAPRSPYEGVSAALGRFDALPAGRRAILLISDGLDTSNGFESQSSFQSIELEQAIRKAQKKSVAVYCIYTAASSTTSGNSRLVGFGQGSLEKLSNQTGGRAFFSGFSSPVSYEPAFKQLNVLTRRQFLLTFLSTHMKKGYYNLEVMSTNPEVKIEHPKGYYYR